MVLEDYSVQLERTEVSELLSNFLQNDIADKNVLSACMTSMKLWQSYLMNIAEVDEERAKRIKNKIIPRLEDAQQAIHEGYAHAIPDIGTYLYECLGDVDSTLFLAQTHDLPIYDWESYMPFYEYKLTKMKGYKNSVSLDRASGALQQLLEIFVPKFRIRSTDDIMSIRSDKKFLAVQSVVSQTELNENTDELVREAANGILQMKEAQESFNKIVKWVTVPLDFLPIPAVGTLIEEVLDKLYEHKLEKKYKWQMFFLDARKKYSQDSVKTLLSGKHE